MQRNQSCCLTLGAVWAMHSGHWLRTLACLLSRSNAATSLSALSISSKKTNFGKPNILTLNRVIWSKKRFLSLRSQPAFLNLSSCSRPSRLRITKTWPKKFTISWPPELSYTSATTVGTIWLSWGLHSEKFPSWIRIFTSGMIRLGHTTSQKRRLRTFFATSRKVRLVSSASNVRTTTESSKIVKIKRQCTESGCRPNSESQMILSLRQTTSQRFKKKRRRMMTRRKKRKTRKQHFDEPPGKRWRTANYQWMSSISLQLRSKSQLLINF